MAAVLALHTGESVMEDTAIQVTKDNLLYIRAEESILLRKDIVMDLF
jgi:hypothetical protein